MRNVTIAAAAAVIVGTTGMATAQVPVYDAATFNKSRETAQNTLQILQTARDTLELTQRTMDAITGTRQDGDAFQNVAVGSGFSIGQAPSIGDIFNGGSNVFGNLPPEIAEIATTIINGLSLLQELRTFADGVTSPTQENYRQAVSSATALAAQVAGTQRAATARTRALQSAAGRIGQARDLKGALDQNTMLQVQQGLTTNELIGTMNGAVQALQQEMMDELIAKSGSADFVTTDPSYDPFQ